MGTLYGSSQEEDWMILWVMMIQLIQLRGPFMKIVTLIESKIAK
jgi:hypothetical protein